MWKLVSCHAFILKAMCNANKKKTKSQKLGNGRQQIKIDYVFWDEKRYSLAWLF
jgi:hypothetical protein